MPYKGDNILIVYGGVLQDGKWVEEKQKCNFLSSHRIDNTIGTRNNVALVITFTKQLVLSWSCYCVKNEDNNPQSYQIDKKVDDSLDQKRPPTPVMTNGWNKR